MPYKSISKSYLKTIRWKLFCRNFHKCIICKSNKILQRIVQAKFSSYFEQAFEMHALSKWIVIIVLLNEKNVLDH